MCTYNTTKKLKLHGRIGPHETCTNFCITEKYYLRSFIEIKERRSLFTCYSVCVLFDVPTVVQNL
jgi:hypothetical protein